VGSKKPGDGKVSRTHCDQSRPRTRSTASAGVSEKRTSIVQGEKREKAATKKW